MKLDSDIRRLGETIQRRRREATARVAKGEIMHLRFMVTPELLGKASRNLDHLNPNGSANTKAEAYVAAADCAAYMLAVAERIEDPVVVPDADGAL